MVKMKHPVLQRGMVLSLFTVAVVAQLSAQTDPTWSRTYGGSDFEGLTDFASAQDGGYFAVGNTASSNGDVTGHHGQSDLWVIRTDAVGDLVWQRALGGSEFDFGWKALPTTDGGCVLVGSSGSMDGDVSENLGEMDFWVVKVSSTGLVVWERVYGGSGNDEAFTGMALEDGTFILAGISRSEDGDVLSNFGSSDVWIIRISSTGDLLQQRSFGGSLEENARAICASPDGAFVLTGTTASQDGDVGENNHSVADLWAVKFTFADGVIWEHTYGADEGYEYGASIVSDNDEGYWVAGRVESEGGDVQGIHVGPDGWVLHLDAAGEIISQRCFGGSGIDSFSDVVALSNGNAIVCGNTSSTDGDVETNIAGFDGWLVRISDDGALLWERCYGGSAAEGFDALLVEENGTYTLTGFSESSDGDVPGNQGSSDCWLLQLEPDFTSVSEFVHVEALQLAPNPATTSLSVQHDVPTRATLTIHDARGALVRMEQGVFPARLTLSVEDLVPGMYRVSLTAGGSVRAASFVRE